MTRLTMLHSAASASICSKIITIPIERRKNVKRMFSITVHQRGCVTSTKLTDFVADHCLEAVRTSIMCHPDLTPHLLRWAKSLPNHPLVANPNVERECVDWDYLHEFVKTKKYHLPQVLEGMRETGQKMPGSES